MWPGVSGVDLVPPPWPPPSHLAEVAGPVPAPPLSPPDSGHPTVGEQYSGYPAENNLKVDVVLVCSKSSVYVHSENET